MRKFKDIIAEVEKPRAKGEEDFANAHNVEVKPHPTADDTVHTGATTPDGEAAKDGEKAPLKTYKDFTQAAPQPRKGDKKQGDLNPEKVKEGFIQLEDGDEVEVSEDLAVIWNTVNEDLHLENRAGLINTALKNKKSFESVVNFIQGLED
jgi:hypothetical protein